MYIFKGLEDFYTSNRGKEHRGRSMGCKESGQLSGPAMLRRPTS